MLQTDGIHPRRILKSYAVFCSMANMLPYDPQGLRMPFDIQDCAECFWLATFALFVFTIDLTACRQKKIHLFGFAFPSWEDLYYSKKKDAAIIWETLEECSQ